MAYSDQHLQDNVLQLLAECNLELPATFVIAFSGGLDSTVLLRGFKQMRDANSAVVLKAIHINHQLQPEADDWQRQCEEICQAYAVELTCVKVHVNKNAGKGLESAARDARYAAFKVLLKPAELLVTAHHLDDQIETLMLRMLRGSGLTGVAAMQAKKPFHDSHLIRPMLEFSRSELLSYAQSHQLHWVNDPSNTDNIFDRNYLRNKILPLLENRWPSYRQTLGRFSHHAAEADLLLQSYIQQDFNTCLDHEKLDCLKLKNFSQEKQKAILRYWFKQCDIEAPSEKQLHEIRQLIYARQDAKPVVAWWGIELRRFKQQLYLMPALTLFDSQQVLHWDSSEPIAIPGIGSLHATKLPGARLPNVLHVCFRQGGETCHVPGRQGSHTLKNLFQEHNIPPWLRDRTPIIKAGQDIVAVLGVFSVDENTLFELKPFESQ